ncbi:hypothetical protein Hte_006073 [Hypoxylon texense]
MNVLAKHHATAQDWTRLQAVIMRLYLDEDKTLEEVKSYMEKHHEFTTTYVSMPRLESKVNSLTRDSISMYKKKLAGWNAFKNLRLDEVLQILYLKKDRDAARKPSVFFIRDRQVDYDSLQVYLSRNPSIFAKLKAGATPSPEAVRDVSCRSPSLNQSSLRDAIEQILALCVSEYDKRLGPAHSLTAEAYLKYFDAVEREKDPQVQLQSLQERLSRSDSSLTGPSLYGLLKLEHALATCKSNLELGQLNEAEEALSGFEPSSLAARDESFRCVWLGYVQCLKGDFTAAEGFYKESVLAASRTGSRDCVLEALFQLETFLIHAGKPLEAERIRAGRFRLLQKLGSLDWVDQEDILGLEDGTSGPVVTMIHIGSGASSARWRPSAFAEVAEFANTSSSVL